jgi:methylmalonyl-CoA mutase N-terminal domain/subunit
VQADILKEDQGQNTCIFSTELILKVMSRVARRIWAVAMRDKYGANERSQKLKYHIQTSGRSLHAQEI